jgi:hypothetical protein
VPKADPFPQPFKLSGGRFNQWFYIEVVNWIYRQAGRAPPEHNPEDIGRLIGTSEVRHLLGNVSGMYIPRLLKRGMAA